MIRPPKQTAALLTPPKKVKPVAPVKPVAAVKPVKAVKAVKPVKQPSPMARPPVAKTSRAVPSVKTARGVVRTDTHNAANNVPAAAKRKRRGL